MAENAPVYCPICQEVESYCQCPAPGPTEASEPSNPSAPDALDALDGTTGPALFDDVEHFLRRFLVLPDDHAYVACTLWAAHAFLLDEQDGFIDSTPRLAFLSPEPGSGKSRAQEVLESLTPDPLRTASVTIAVLFRTISSEHRPTVYMDEVDAIWTGPGQAEELRALVNAGHRRGNHAHRMSGEGKTLHAEKFRTFSAICLAGLGELPSTVADRSIVIRMKRRTAKEKVEPWRFRTSVPEGQQLAGQLARWAQGIEKLPMPEPDERIQDRAWDTWEALIAIADLIGWHDRAVAAALAFTTAAADSQPGSSGIKLLRDLRRVWPPDIGSGAFVESEELLGRLHALDDSPWGEEPELTARRLASLLKPYGIKPGHSSDKTKRGYYRLHLTDAWTRYLPADEDQQ